MYCTGSIIYVCMVLDLLTLHTLTQLQPSYTNTQSTLHYSRAYSITISMTINISISRPY